MDILGIGIPELIFIVLIGIIVLGPKDMQKAGKTIGRQMRKIITSPEWLEFKDMSSKAKRLPTEWMREANEELRIDLDIEKDELHAKPKQQKIVGPKQNEKNKIIKSEKEKIEDNYASEGENV